MIWPLNMRCKAFGLTFWKDQDGIFPPFMFALLMGIGLFSTISLKVGQKQLQEIAQKRAIRAEEEREDLAKSLEFAILTETADSYDDDISLERARRYTNLSGGKTLSGENAQIIARRSEDAFGASQKRLLIANTDDTLRQIELAETADSEAISRLSSKGEGGVSILETSAIRYRQVETSRQSQNSMAEALYRFFSGQKRFPTPNEYDTLVEQYRLRDAWGTPFTYTRTSDSRAQITFVAPWGEEYPLVVSLD